jgi:agmatine deiminase
MPAEWEPHEATWLAWPHELTDWPGKFSPIPWAFAEIVRHLTRVERVYLLVEDRTAEVRARATLEKAGAIVEAITFFHIPTDRGWMRDSGPIAVVARQRDEAGLDAPVAPASLPANSGEAEETQHRRLEAGATRAGIESAALLNFAFNGWAKYDDWKKDARVVAYANRRLKRNVILPEHKKQRVVLEGGSIDVNGAGTLLTTEECLLSEVQSRNPGFTKFDYAQIFKRYFGVTHVLWLKRGIAGDDTHGHIDDLARFVDARTVVAVSEADRTSENYQPLAENLALLREMKDQDGQPLRVETLPMPKPVWFAGQLLPASYANFYIANRVVLLPVFHDVCDQWAIAVLQNAFPKRTIVPIDCRELIWGLGAFHCLTQQQPKV